MAKSKNYLWLVASILLVAVAGYFIFDGNINVSSTDAAGSGIDGINPAKKHKGIRNAVVDLDDADVQQLLQNDDFQKLIRNEEFVKLMRSPGFSEFVASDVYRQATNEERMQDYMKDQNIQELMISKPFDKLRKSIAEVDDNTKISPKDYYEDLGKLANDSKFKQLRNRDSEGLEDMLGSEKFAAYISDDRMKELAENDDFIEVFKQKVEYERKMSKDDLGHSSSDRWMDLTDQKDISKVMENSAEFKKLYESKHMQNLRKSESFGDLREMVKSDEFTKFVDDERFQEYLQDNPEAIEVLGSESFSKLRKSFAWKATKYTSNIWDVIKDDKFATCAKSKTCLNLISNPAYGKLLRSSSFRVLARSQSFDDMISSPAFTSVMKDETMTKVLESGQFDELQRTAAKKTSSHTTTDKTYDLGTTKPTSGTTAKGK